MSASISPPRPHLVSLGGDRRGIPTERDREFPNCIFRACARPARRGEPFSSDGLFFLIWQHANLPHDRSCITIVEVARNTPTAGIESRVVGKMSGHLHGLGHNGVKLKK
jgi:hypothetical protein